MLIKSLLFWSGLGCAGLDATIHPKEVVAPEDSDKAVVEKNGPAIKPEAPAAEKSRVVVVRGRFQTQIWIEGNKPLLYKGSPEIFWIKNAVIIHPANKKLYRYYGSDGLEFYSPSLTTMATPIDMLSPRDLEVNWKKHRSRVQPIISGVPPLLRMKRKGAAIELDAIVSAGPKASPPTQPPPMSWLAGQAHPEKATLLSLRRADPMLKTVWLSELRELTGVPSKILNDRLMDLDRDGQDEALVEISGPEGTHGYIVDKEAGIRRYIEIEYSMRGSVLFSYDDRLYLVGRQKGKRKRSRRSLLYFDGEYRLNEIDESH